MIVIKEAKFLTSATNLSSCPPPDKSEIAFLGRSNVGKSTFINMILDQPSLAKSSSTPGKTRLINFFESIWIDNCSQDKVLNFRLIDLPGFGYAKVSKETKKDWGKNLWDFLKNRTNIKLFIHLIDSRHIELEIDKYVDEILNTLIRGDQKILNIHTKFDKLNKNDQHKLYKNCKIVASNNDKIIDKRYGGKNKIRELIFDGVLGIE